MRRRPTLPLIILLLLHVYVASRLLPALALPWPVLLVCGLALLASLVLIPTALFNRGRPEAGLKQWWTWAGLIAAGWFSSLFVLTLLRDVLLLGAALLNLHAPALAAPAARAVVLLSLLASALGFFNARRTARVVDVEIPIAGLPDALQGFTIAQLSDLHVGPTIDKRYVERVVERINGLQADLIAVTGDLVDGSVQALAAHTAPLAQLKARYGAFLVTGNHEYYSHAPNWITEFRRLGLTVLLNEHRVIEHGGEQVVVGGVTDYTAHHFVPEHRSDPHQALSGAPADAALKLLLAHQPRSASKAAQAGYHLQLSGHTHGGQFFPWNFFVPLQQPFVAGLARVQDLLVYTSRGTGYWGPPKRLLAPSEIARLTLVAA